MEILKKKKQEVRDYFFFTEKIILDDTDRKLDFSLESRGFLKVGEIACFIREN